ncbi:MAG: hypothetical protein BGO29_04445 [Bacteroidales bacterium 36-12]|jgi:drug/metabolite transporter (DMT)-like permease|nr:MAG: hypothetical protein BGO29_04445 [Bacteroidales bacterium 36-12]
MYKGEIAAFAVAICWTLSALFFEKAGRKIGSISVNFIRIVLTFILLGFTLLFTGNNFIPFDASGYQWFWLGLSGVVGLFLGDMFLFRSYLLIGSRTAALIMSLVPVITTIIGWFFLKEVLALKSIIAIIISFSGIVIVIVDKKLKFRMPLKGLMFAFLGATGQALGLILSKKGIGSYDPLAATQIRIIFALIFFVIMLTFSKQWHNVHKAVKDINGLKSVIIGSFFGAFIGITLSLYAVQQTKTGIASTFMSLVPVLIIAPSAIMFKEKIKPHQVIGAIISIIGVSIFFW